MTEPTPTDRTDLTGPEIATLVEADLGIDHDEFRSRTKLARWKVADWREELSRPGWQERFAAAYEAGRAPLVGERVKRYLRHGPVALADLGPEQLLERVDPKLRPLATGLRPEHGGRLICGPTGIGKSTALVSVLWRCEWARPEATHRDDDFSATPQGDWAFWARAADLPFARLSHGLGEGEAELVALAKNAPVLVLDDLGWESQRAGAADVIAEVIGERYDRGRITWATTGMRPEQVTEKYGEAFVRRICETGGKAGKVMDLWPRESRS